MAIPAGAVKRASEPTPSSLLRCPASPASVVTTPAVVTTRMVLLPVSAT